MAVLLQLMLHFARSPFDLRNTMEEPASHATHHPVPAQWARSVFLALLPVLAVFLGGATSKWAEGIIVAFFGAFLIFQPPRRSLGWKINATFLAFALCALAPLRCRRRGHRCVQHSVLSDPALDSFLEKPAQFRPFPQSQPNGRSFRSDFSADTRRGPG